MGLNSHREFAVLAFSPESVRGCLFRRRGGRYVLERHLSENIAASDPADAWKRVLKVLGKGRDCPLYLTGALEDGFFFQTRSIELPTKAMRGAIELELPQRLLKVPEECAFQFAAGTPDENGDVPVNVYAAPGASLERPAAMLTQSGGRADEFLYPLLSLQMGDPAVDLPRLDADFLFADGEWRPRTLACDNAAWAEVLSRAFTLPTDGSFRINDYLECLLAARLAASPEFSKLERGLRLLPDELRPRRYRNQLRITALLALLLAVNYLWSAAGSWGGSYREYSAAAAERTRLKQENTALSTRLRATDKELKELNRVVSLKPGEADVVGKLADFTAILPSNVMVSSLRWSESSLDLILQSEAENLDLPALLRKLPVWKVEQLQQRRMGDTVTMITLKLVSAGGEGK